MAKNSFLGWIFKRGAIAIFLTGKLIRYFFYFLFLYFLTNQTQGFLGYTKDQILFFAVSYLFVDVAGQFFFRNVYTFRQLVISGDLDLILSKPTNSLFRVLMGGPDLLDLITIPPIIFLIFYFGTPVFSNFANVFYYSALLLNGLIISAAFHIFVLAFGVITLEVDNLVMIYRDILSMGRFPIDIYKEPIKSLLLVFVPIGIMTTVPAKAMIGLVSPVGVLSALIFGVSLFTLSTKFWQLALKKYTSASS